MDTTFISYLLTFCLAVILVAYLYQITDGAKTNKNSNNKLNSNSFVAMINHLNNTINNNEINENNKQTKDCMPIHHVGPIRNFHQSFGKYKTMPFAGLPTGIPEMGWRNYFLANYSTPHTKPEDPFSGIPTRNFLNNMKSVDNLYRKC